MKASNKAYIFLNGDFEKPLTDFPMQPADGDIVIAADAGAAHALAINWKLTALVGDMDSLDNNMLKNLSLDGVKIYRHPGKKNETDFELAARLALEMGYESIEVLGALGKRWDMTLANLMLPEAFQSQAPRIRFRHGAWNFFSLTGPTSLSISGQPGDLLSLLPLGGDVHGVSLDNCLYELKNDILKGGYTRGLSNEFSGDKVTLSVQSGVLMLIHKQENLDR